MFFVIITQSRRILIVRNQHWLEKPIAGKFSRYYFSPNSDDAPNFAAKTKFLFDKNSEGCYDCFVYRCCGEYNCNIVSFDLVWISICYLVFCFRHSVDDMEAAEKYAEKKRPIFPIGGPEVSTSVPMEIIDLTDDDLNTSGK